MDKAGLSRSPRKRSVTPAPGLGVSPTNAEEAARARVFHALARATADLLHANRFEDKISSVLGALGRAVGVSRTWIGENGVDEQNQLTVSLRFEWVAEGIVAQLPNPAYQSLAWNGPALAEWAQRLTRGELVIAHEGELNPAEAALLAEQDVRSLLMLPIFVGERFWGVMGYTECTRARRWIELELDALRVCAEAVGAAVAREGARLALIASEQRFRLLAENALDLICLHDARGRYVYVSPSAQRILGYTAPELLGRHPYDFVHAEDVARLGDGIVAELRSGSTVKAVEFRMLSRRGQVVWLESLIQPLLDERRKLIGAVSSCREIGARRALESRLRAERERAHVTLGSLAEGVITTDAGDRIDYMNPAAARVTGWNASVAVGSRRDHVLILSKRETAYRFGVRRETALLHTRTGETRRVELSENAIRGPDGGTQGRVAVFRDITDAEAMARELAFSASHDALTGLPNREEFGRQVKRLCEDARRTGATHALCYLGLDRFSVINESCGHAAGDELLKLVPIALRRHLKEGDIVARLGGDEFGVLLAGHDEPRARAWAEQALGLLRALNFSSHGRSFEPSGSIGIALISPSVTNAETPLMSAAAACYVAKEQGAGRVHVHTGADRAVTRRQGEMHWIHRLSVALEIGDFRLRTQDIVPTSAGTADGRHFEVLLALPDMKGGFISPGMFLPAAQRYGLMGRIDRWVVGRVIERLARHEDTGARTPEVCAINLSGASLSDPGFHDFVDEQLAQLRDPHQVCFEVTESEAIANLAEAAEFIRRLKSRGCQFALDDFGAGLSSFAYLKNLPVDYLKIDGQFVRECAESHVDLAMVEAIHRVGHVMGLKTIAEFVETSAIHTRLAQIGVDFCQGYFFGQPELLRM